MNAFVFTFSILIEQNLNSQDILKNWLINMRRFLIGKIQTLYSKFNYQFKKLNLEGRRSFQTF